jgi:glycosyl transferase family 87
MRDSLAIGVLSAIALSFMLWLAWIQRERILPGHNDFIQLYTGARLAFTGELYDRARVTEVQQETVGVTGEAWRYTRLPYYAGLLWPLGLLPYRAAYGVWQALSIGALAGFAALWRPPRLGLTVLFTLLSLPAFAGLMNGQDLSFVLLWLALAARWYKSDRPFWAGLALALCASKFHLFVLLPVLIVGQRAWRLAAGLACGGAALVVLSFAVGGVHWPMDYWRVLTDPAIHPGAGHMPNLHGLMSFWPAVRWLEWPAAALTVAAVWRVARRGDFDIALAATLAGGLLVSYHSYLPDCSVLLPAALVVLSTTASAWLRVLAMFLLTPVAYFLLVQKSAVAALIPAAVLALVVVMALEVKSYTATSGEA